MKAILSNDKCYTTIKHRVGQAFCSDGVAREKIDLDEAAKAFDFEINRYNSYTQDGRIIPNVYHLRRTDDDSILPVRGVSQEFKPIQHKQVFEYIANDIMPQVPEMELETVGTMHGGATGVIVAKFGENYQLKGDASPHESRLFFFNPNGKSSMILGFTNVRLFCENQLPAALKGAKKSGFRERHTTNADVRVDEAVKTIYEQVGASKRLRLREERLAELPAGERELNLLLDKLYPLNRFEENSLGWTRMNNQRLEVIKQFTEGETAMSFDGDSALKLFNAVTYTIYNPQSIGKTTDLAQLTYAGMIGGRAEKVHKTLRTVEALCGVRAA